MLLDLWQCGIVYYKIMPFLIHKSSTTCVRQVFLW